MVVCSVLLISPMTVRAELADATEMSNVASNWAVEKAQKAGGWAGSTAPVVSESHELWHDGVLVGRYFDVQPRGYVLVPVLKELSPVKVYSDESDLGPSQEGGMVQMIAELLYQRMEAFRAVYGSYAVAAPVTDETLFGTVHRDEWARLDVAAKDFRAVSATGVEAQGGPLVSVSWDQGAPYNNECPLGDGGRTVVGCVATATSQIMKFWEWPASGVGVHYFTWQGDFSCGGSTPSQFLLASFSDTYDWANMPDDCDAGCNATQNAALAELNFEVGVAHNMDYGACGSGANTGRAAYILPTFFKYKNTTQIVYRNEYSQQGWFDLIKLEVDAGRPIQYRINSHSIVCDGYRDDNPDLEFHMNYGWNEGHTAWYVLDQLYCSWIDGDICPWNEEYMIVGIEPQLDPVMQYATVTVDDPSGNSNGHADPGETVEITLFVGNAGNDATGTTASLSTSDPNITLNTSGATFAGPIGWGEVAPSDLPFQVTVDGSCPDPYWATIDVSIEADGGFTGSGSFLLFVGSQPGIADDLETGEGNWEHVSLTQSHLDEWHIETARYHSSGHSFKMGGAGMADYSSNADGALMSPPMLLPADARLTFWHWMTAEDDVDNMAWDGGAVYISRNGGDWEQVYPTSGYTHTLLENSSSSLGSGTPCYSGYIPWTEATFDLSAYSGVVRIMFRFGSDGAVTGEGWYVDDIWIGNTLEGTDVTVYPVDGISVTFPAVYSRGITTVSVVDSGPETPAGYSPMPGSPLEFCDWSSDAVFDGPVELCLAYEEADLVGDESRIALMAYTGSEWADVTYNLDTEANLVCTQAGAYTPYLVAQKIGCCVGRVGDANNSGADEPTIGDVTALIDMLFISEVDVPCLAEADINASGGPNPTRTDVTVGDISRLIDYMFITGHDLGLADCQ